MPLTQDDIDAIVEVLDQELSEMEIKLFGQNYEAGLTSAEL
jgi:hypothetical protein